MKNRKKIFTFNKKGIIALIILIAMIIPMLLTPILTVAM